MPWMLFVVAVLIVGTGGTAVADAELYRPEPGPFDVLTVQDMRLATSAPAAPDARGTPRGVARQTLPVTVRSPRLEPGAPALPMVIFSHGAGGDGRGFGSLSNHLASYGYVVVHPTHGDSIRLRRQAGEVIRLDRGFEQAAVERVRLHERVADVRLIIDSIPAIERAIHAAAGDEAVRIDRERLGVAGHSAGAMTAQLLAGTRVFPAGGTRGIVYGDPRLKAFVLISPRGATGPPFLRPESWRDVRSPLLVIAGSADVTAADHVTPESRRHPFELAPAGDKFLAYIADATHLSYDGGEWAHLLGDNLPDNVDYVRDVTTTLTLALFDAYLRQDRAAAAYLASDRIHRHPGGDIEFLRK
jgi:predicted dienelactone hydrolase